MAGDLNFLLELSHGWLSTRSQTTERENWLIKTNHRLSKALKSMELTNKYNYSSVFN